MEVVVDKTLRYDDYFRTVPHAYLDVVVANLSESTTTSKQFAAPQSLQKKALSDCSLLLLKFISQQSSMLVLS
jgi:hypothetical protein